MSLGENIKDIRTNKKIKQSEIANKLNVTVRTVQNYESGNREPNIETLKKLSFLLDVPMIKLIEGKKLEETPLKGILSNTTENSSIEQQVLAYSIDKRINTDNANSEFLDLLSDFLRKDFVQKELNYNFDDLATKPKDLRDLAQFTLYMLKLKMIEINSKNN